MGIFITGESFAGTNRRSFVANTVVEDIQKMETEAGDQDFNSSRFVQFEITELNEGDPETSADLKDTQVVRTKRKQKCQYCLMSLNGESQKEEHEQICLHVLRTLDDPICGICQKSFINTRNLRLHIKRHLTISSKKCEYCLKIFRKALDKVSHMRVWHQNQNPIADSELRANQGRQCEQIRRQGDASQVQRNFEFKCPLCSEIFPDRDKYESHRSDIHQCPKCGKVFEVTEMRGEHLKGCQADQFLQIDSEFECTTCLIVFSNSNSLQQHNDVVHKQNTDMFPCRLCSKVFCSKERYQQHLIRHENSAPMTCHICLQVFAGKEKIRHHMDSHLRTKSNKCQYCSKSFTSILKMQKHESLCRNFQKVTGSVFRCNLCKKFFQGKKLFKDHRMRHLKVTPTTCEYCLSYFTMPSDKKIHLQLSHKDKSLTIGSEISCCLCKKVVKQKYLSRHIAIMHLKCQACLTIFETISDKVAHEKMCKKELIFESEVKCAKCMITFPSSSEYNKHIRTAHVFETVNYTCLVCFKVFPDREQLEQHKSLRTCCESQKSANKDIQMSSNQSKNSENASVQAVKEDSLKSVVVKLVKEETMITKSNVVKGASVNEDVQMSSNLSETSETASVHAAKEDSLKSVVVKEETMITTENNLEIQLKTVTTHSEVLPGGESSQFPCQYCQANFPSSLKAQEHENICRHFQTVSSSSTTFSCSICMKTFKNWDSFNHHKKRHLTITSTTCQYCLLNFKSCSQKMYHMKLFHKNNDPYLNTLYKCLVCKEVFKDNNTLVKHTSEVHLTVFEKLVPIKPVLKSEVNCTRCKISFPSRSEYSNHRCTVHIAEPTYYTCLVCYQVFSGQDHLQQHKNEQASCNIPQQPRAEQERREQEQEELNIVKTVPNEVPKKKTQIQHKCSLCLKPYTKRTLVFSHMHLHHTPAVCPHCGKVCTGRRTLSHHIKKHTENNDSSGETVFQNQEFKCPKCLIDFSSKTDFDDHLRTVHLPIVEYLCLECSEVFPDREQLQHHEKIPCSSEVTSKTSNDATVTDATMVPCRRCSKICISPRGFMLHMQSAHPESSDCSVCDQAFSTKTELHVHMKTHLLCRVCPQRFHSLVETVKHMRTVHENCDSEKVLPGVFTCSVCSEVCRGVHIFEKHLTKHQVSHQCQYCQMIFPTLHPYREHMNLVHGITEFNMDPSKMKIIPTSDQELRIVLILNVKENVEDPEDLVPEIPVKLEQPESDEDQENVEDPEDLVPEILVKLEEPESDDEQE
ncbi:hypothetical protein DMENIID0001_006340 [Sergentomyia squamirostris]